MEARHQGAVEMSEVVMSHTGLGRGVRGANENEKRT